MDREAIEIGISSYNHEIASYGITEVLPRTFRNWILAVAHIYLVCHSSSRNWFVSAADSLKRVQERVESYAGLVREFRFNIGYAYFNLAVQSHPISLTWQRQIVCILRGESENVLKIDGVYFKYERLEMWTEQATFIAFQYHAFALYIALLLDNHSMAMEAIQQCEKSSEGAKGRWLCSTANWTRPSDYRPCTLLGSNNQTPSIWELDRWRLAAVSVAFAIFPFPRKICPEHLRAQSSLPRREWFSCHANP